MTRRLRALAGDVGEESLRLGYLTEAYAYERA